MALGFPPISAGLSPTQFFNMTPNEQRPIKFRYWNEIYKTWEQTEYMIGNKGFIRMRNSIPCQFIGVFDKNGKEIYEGDILDIGEDYDYQKNLLVRWCDKACAFLFDNGTTRSFGFISTEHPIVIGNKFENPELLTQSL